jgi:RimJ/RimL family protein N-acetyltransferase
VKDNNPIGFIALNNINYIHKICALGIVIGVQEAQGKGFGEEALRLIIGYAFNTLNLNKISVEVVAFNKKALSIYKKLGFIEEGRLKQQFYADGVYSDVIMMAVFKN